MKGALVEEESFGVKLRDFGTPQQAQILAVQPPLRWQCLSPIGLKSSSQGSQTESTSENATIPSSTGIMEQRPNLHDSRPLKPKDSMSSAVTT